MEGRIPLIFSPCRSWISASWMVCRAESLSSERWRKRDHSHSAASSSLGADADLLAVAVLDDDQSLRPEAEWLADEFDPVHLELIQGGVEILCRKPDMGLESWNDLAGDTQGARH
jgi:hypothetical protein